MAKVFMVTDEELKSFVNQQNAELLNLVFEHHRQNPELSTEELLALAHQHLTSAAPQQIEDNTSLSIEPVDEYTDNSGINYNDSEEVEDERPLSSEDEAFEVVEDQPLYDESVEEVEEPVLNTEADSETVYDEPNQVDAISEEDAVEEPQSADPNTFNGNRRVYRGLFVEASELDK